MATTYGGKGNLYWLQSRMLATNLNWLMIDFEVYQRIKTNFGDASLGVGASVIFELSKSILRGRSKYVDRFFSFIPLLEFELNVIGPAQSWTEFLRDTTYTTSKIAKWKVANPSHKVLPNPNNSSLYQTAVVMYVGESIHQLLLYKEIIFLSQIYILVHDISLRRGESNERDRNGEIRHELWNSWSDAYPPLIKSITMDAGNWRGRNCRI